MEDKPKEKTGAAYVKAELLWALQPFVEYGRAAEPFRFHNGHVFLEPCAEGGAIVGAVTGHAMAVFRDPAGQCTGPMTVDLPDAFFKACASHEDVSYGFCGDSYSVPVPDWMQPWTAFFTTAGVTVHPKMRPPCWADMDREFAPMLYDRIAGLKQVHYEGLDYRWSDGTPANWRRPLLEAKAAKPCPMHPASPRVIALFSRAEKLLLRREKNLIVCHSPREGGQCLVTCCGQPDFLGTYMGLKAEEAPSLPTWFEKTVQYGVRTRQ